MGGKLDQFHRTPDGQCPQGDGAQRERLLLSDAEELKSGGHSRSPELIGLYNELGGLYRSHGRFAQSLSAFEKARALAEETLGRECGQYATTLNNMAGTYRLMRSYEKAIELFEEAAQICRRAGRQGACAYAGVLTNLSLACREARQPQLAAEYLEQALEQLQSLPDHRQEAVVACNNLTALYDAMGERDAAMRCLNRALQEYEKCTQEERAGCAAALNSLGGFLYGRGEYARALALYRRSAESTRRFFGPTAQYALTLQNMRWALEKLGRHRAAAAALKRAGDVLETLFGPEDERTAQAREDLRRLRQETR